MWEANHVRKCNNAAAHLLVRHASSDSSISDSVIWVEDTPLIITTQVCMDVSLLGLCPI